MCMYLISCMNVDKWNWVKPEALISSSIKDDNLRKVLLRLKEITSENTYLLPPSSSHVALCIFIAFITV